MGTGSLLFSLPHFITDEYLSEMDDLNMGGLDVCSTEDFDETENARKIVTKLQHYKWFFLFGQFLHGIGAAPIITLGTTAIDESVDKLSAPLYIGIFQTFFVIGPAIGYMAGGATLSMFVDFNTRDDIPFELTTKDSLWVGAWWLGFLIAWVLIWTLAVCMLFFPARVRRRVSDSRPVSPSFNDRDNFMRTSARKVRESVVSVGSIIDSTVDEKGYGSLRHLPSSILELLKNPTYMLVQLGSAVDGLVVAGLSTFLPKFIQFQYGYSAGFSAAIVGMIVVPAGGLGTFSGGYIVKKFGLGRRDIIKMYILCQLITIPTALNLLMYCDSPSFAGIDQNSTFINVEVDGSSMFTDPSCNANCNNCESIGYKPICGVDDRIYFNPCFAGCTVKKEEDVISYTDCSCIPNNQTAVAKQCESGCSYFVGYVVLLFVIIWFTFMSSMPNVVATLRFVEPIHRSLGLGIGTIILR